MAEQDTLSRKKIEKFFFDKNNFDDDHMEVIEKEEEPPPPVYTEEDIEQAKKNSFTRGKEEGLAEAEKSYQKYILETLQNISKTLPSLLEQEDRRNALYERESIELSLAIFKKLFPTLNQENGLNEIKNVITRVLEHQKESPEIIINVQPDYVDDIQNMINDIMQKAPYKGKIKISEQRSLGPADCKLSWKDGGGERNAELTAQEIEKHLKQTLADTTFVADNGEDDDEASTDITADVTILSHTPETETENE